jgi:hypothetical protein
LDQVEEQHAPAGVALGDRHHQPQVGLHQVVLRALSVADDPQQVAAPLYAAAPIGGLRQPFGGVEAGLDPLGELHLTLRIE